MPQPRKSVRRLALAGNLRRDRHKVAPPPAGDVGDPPQHFAPALAALWREFVAEAEGRLSRVDRKALELAVLAFAASRKGPTTAALVAATGAALDRLGLSPKSRGETTAGEPRREPNEFDEF